MYIEFALPQYRLHAFALTSILQKLQEWGSHYDVKYRTKINKQHLRLTFDDDAYYTLFIVSWTPKSDHEFWTNYRVVRDLNNKI